MNDKDWLKKVYTAYKFYKEAYPNQKDLDTFINWLYKEYGIVLPKDNK